MNSLGKDLTDLFDEEYNRLYLSCICEEDDEDEKVFMVMFVFQALIKILHVNIRN